MIGWIVYICREKGESCKDGCGNGRNAAKGGTEGNLWGHHFFQRSTQYSYCIAIFNF